MTGAELRGALAAAASEALPAGWITYAGPPEAVAFPCAVVVPGSPYLSPSTMCAGLYRVGVSLLMPRSAGVAILDTLDPLAELVRKSLMRLGGVLWEGTDMGPMIAPGGVEAYGSTINLQAYA